MKVLDIINRLVSLSGIHLDMAGCLFDIELVFASKTFKNLDGCKEVRSKMRCQSAGSDGGIGMFVSIGNYD